jgi:hypothetical protein
MGLLNNLFHDRVTSGFALSISTGLAMETLFTPREAVYDPERVAPLRVSVSKYNYLFVNIQTLIRNLLQALPRERLDGVSPPMLVEVLQQEIEIIQDLLRIEGQGVCQPTFYSTDYSRLLNGYDHFRLRIDKTPIQKRLRWVSDQAKQMLLDENKSILKVRDHFSLTAPYSVLMLTHLPLDLLSYPIFRSLELLESHTGKIKDRLEFNSKYHHFDDAGFERLPFNRPLLYIFGDSSMIVPTGLKIRRTILELAKTQRWTPITSVQRVRMDLQKQFKDDPLLNDLRKVPNF